MTFEAISAHFDVIITLFCLGTNTFYSFQLHFHFFFVLKLDYLFLQKVTNSIVL